MDKMAYSTEIREKALRQYIDGYTDEQISAGLGVSTHTIGNWKRLLLSTGSLEKKPVRRKSGTPYKYKPEKLKVFLDGNQSPEPDPVKAKKPKKGKKKKRKAYYRKP